MCWRYSTTTGPGLQWTGSISSFIGEKSVTQRWERDEITVIDSDNPLCVDWKSGKDIDSAKNNNQKKQKQLAMDSSASFAIRSGTEDDIDEIWKIVYEEGWEVQSRHVIQAMFRIAKDGWLVAERNGNIIGIVFIYMAQGCGFIGHLIVKPDQRGKGFGRALLDKVEEVSGERRLCLAAIADKETFYAKLGFTRSPFGIVVLYQFTQLRVPVSSDVETNYEVKKWFDVDWGEFLAYDASVHGISREKILKAWVDMEESTTSVVLKDGLIAGYGIITPVTGGYAVGPLCVDDDEVALVLLKHLTGTVSADSTVFMCLRENSIICETIIEFNKENAAVRFKVFAMENKTTPRFSDFSKLAALHTSFMCYFI